jgi:hypothetical protein
MIPSLVFSGQVLKLVVSHPEWAHDAFLSFWSVTTSGGGGANVDSNTNVVPPLTWRHRPTNWVAINGKTKDLGESCLDGGRGCGEVNRQSNLNLT